jgi:hypothetical protein
MINNDSTIKPTNKYKSKTSLEFGDYLQRHFIQKKLLEVSFHFNCVFTFLVRPQSSRGQCQPFGDPGRAGLRPQQTGQLGTRQHRKEPR